MEEKHEPQSDESTQEEWKAAARKSQKKIVKKRYQRLYREANKGYGIRNQAILPIWLSLSWIPSTPSTVRPSFPRAAALLSRAGPSEAAAS